MASLIIWDQFWEIGNTQVDREIFRPVLRIDPFLIGYNRKARTQDEVSPYSYAEKIKFKVQTFDDYLDFIAFVKNQNFNYETKTDQALRTLKETAKKEKYYQLSENEFTALSKKLFRNLEQDMNVFSKEIKILLEESIVDRY